MQRERCTWQCWHRDVLRKAGVTGQHLPATHQRSRGTRSSQCNLTYAPNMFLVSYTTAFKDYLKRNIEITSTGKVLADSCWEHGVQGCTAWDSQSSPTPLFAVRVYGLESSRLESEGKVFLQSVIVKIKLMPTCQTSSTLSGTQHWGSSSRYYFYFFSFFCGGGG